MLYKTIFTSVAVMMAAMLHAQTIVYVNQGASGANNGTSWANAYTSLQAGIDAAALNTPAQVWVKAGTYYPTTGTDRTISFVMKNDVEIYGGFAGTETLLNQRNWKANETILSGDIGVPNDNTDNSKVVIHNSNFPSTPLTLSAKLNGFIVEDGYLDDAALMGGAGMRNNNSSPTVINCIFRNNQNTQISNAGTRGGAILNVSESSPVIQSCVFYGNSARSGGAIAYRSIVVYSIESYIYNCLFYNNTSYYLGGAIYVENHGVTLINNTVVGNANTGTQGYGWGGGIYYQSINGAAAADFANNIFWDNSALIGDDIFFGGSQNFATLTTNVVESYNDTYPEFSDPLNNDYSLNYCSNSSAINTGTNSFVPGSLTLDLDQSSRIHNTTVDIGAYESQAVKPFFNSIATADVSCYGAADGMVEYNTGGGSGTLSFSIDGVSFTTNSIISGLDVGTYTLTMKDANGCTVTSPITISQPTEMILTSSSENITCNGADDGSITVTAAGSSGNYQYQLNSGAFQSSNTFSNLSAGSYMVTVRDQGTTSCSVTTGPILLTEPDLLSLTSINKVDVTCNGADDGIFAFGVSGGTGPYERSIDGVNFQTGALQNLSPGSYVMTLRDSKGCTLLENFVINEPTVLELSVTKMDLICNDALTGQIDVTPSGGTSPYEYSIDGTTFQIGTNFSGLAAGSYIVSIRDGNNCLATESITIDEPDTPQLSLIVNDISCHGANDGSITLSPSGGTSPLTFSLDNSSFGTITNFTNLEPGNYTITTKDGNSCLYEDIVTIVDPDQLTLSAQFDGTHVTVTPSGGTAPFNYAVDGTAYQSDNTFLLANGQYTFMVRDANNCEATTTQSLVITSLDNGVEDILITPFPNPTTNTITLSGVSDKVDVRLLDTTGKVVIEEILFDPGDEIPVHHLKSGIYILDVTTINGIRATFRLIKK